MKYHRKLGVMFLIADILLLLLSLSSLTAFASENQRELVSQIEEAMNVTVFHQKGEDRLIKCFDATEDGDYAIGYKNNTVHVYDSLGTFQYGYRFHTDGTYGIALKENSLVIYLGRSGTAVELDQTGKCVHVQKVNLSKSENDAINRTFKKTGNVSYSLERDIGIFYGDYSRLVKIDEHGTRVVLYDVTEKGYFAGIFHYLILSIFPIAGIALIVHKVKSEA